MKHHADTKGSRCIALRAKGRPLTRSIARSLAGSCSHLFSSSIAISPTHASSSFFPPRLSDSHGRLVAALRSPELLNYESPASFTFIYRCAIPLDLPPRFSRLLFPFFVPAPSNLLFRREIPFRLLLASVRSFRSSVRKSIDKIHIVTSHRIKSRLMERFRPFAS